MHAHDEDTWRVPRFHGTLRARGGSFHIWDATDDFSAVSMDLHFDGGRLHLHNAAGSFGAVPMGIHGACSGALHEVQRSTKHQAACTWQRPPAAGP